MGFIQVGTELSCSSLSEGIWKNYHDISSVAASGFSCWLWFTAATLGLKERGHLMCVDHMSDAVPQCQRRKVTEQGSDPCIPLENYLLLQPN